MTFKVGSKVQISQDGQFCPERSFSSPDDFKKCVTPKPFILSRRANNRWKDKKVFYNYCICLTYLSLGQISPIKVLYLHLLTAACSQVRFGVSAKIFILKFLWQIRGCPPVMVFPWYDMVFILCP
jgi:hypothetical protein